MRKLSIPRQRLRLETIALTIILAVSLSTWQSAHAQRSRRGARTTKVGNTQPKADNGNSYDETIASSLIDNFVNNTKSASEQPDITPVRNYYNGLNNTGKQQLLTAISDRTIQLLESDNKDDALHFTHLYTTLADKNDEKLPTMLYIKGVIYSEKLDSESVVNVIQQLESCNSQNEQYINDLKDHLDKVRNYEPQLQRIGDGVWVSGAVDWDNQLLYEGWGTNKLIRSNASPHIFMKTNYDLINDTAAFVIDGCCSLKYAMLRKTNGIFVGAYNEDDMSQYILPFGSDSIYVLWCSEKLNRNSPEFASFLRGTISFAASEVSAEYAQRNEHSFGAELGMKLLTSVTEIGVNMLIDALFTPTKKMYCLEGRFKIENKHTMTGTLKFQFQTINAEGEMEIKMTHGRVTFNRWLPESGIVFDKQYYGFYAHPSMCKINHNVKDDYLDIIWKERKEYKKLKKSFEKDKTTRYAQWEKNGTIKKNWAWNDDQYKWLVLYNDSVLASQGINSTLLEDVVSYVGLDVVDIPEKEQKKFKDTSLRGAYVNEVELIGAANVAGVQKGDIIVEVNGSSINSGNEFNRIVSFTRPGEWLNCTILRGKKSVNLPIRVTWKN